MSSLLRRSTLSLQTFTQKIAETVLQGSTGNDYYAKYGFFEETCSEVRVHDVCLQLFLNQTLKQAFCFHLIYNQIIRLTAFYFV